MRTAALQKIQLDATDLYIHLLLDDLCQDRGQATHLSVAEAIGLFHLGLGDKAAVGVVYALGYCHQAVAFFGVDTLDIVNKLRHIKVRLRQIDEVRAGAVFTGQSGGGGQPASMAAHNLHNHHHTGVIHMGVQIHLHKGGGNVLGGRGVAGAVVRAVKVVVDGLGHAHDPALIAHRLHVLVDFVAGVHGVVAAVIEEVADIVFLENLQDALEIRVVHGGVGQLIAAGAQGGGGGVFQQTQLLGVLLAHVKQPVIQHTLDAVLRAQHPGDNAAFQRCVNNAVGAGVDNGCRPAGLADDTGAFQYIHGINTSCDDVCGIFFRNQLPYSTMRFA